MNPNEVDRSMRPPTSAETLTTHILAQIRDNLSAINRKQDSIGEEVRDSSARIIRLEERDERLTRLQSQVDTIDVRVDVLLKDKDRRDGAIGAWTWLIRNWPTLIAFMAMMFVVLRANGKI